MGVMGCNNDYVLGKKGASQQEENPSQILGLTIEAQQSELKLKVN